jgi:hypothetical protein
LSAALWNKFSPVPVEVRYHFQKALLRLSLGYYLRFISIFPLNFWSEAMEGPEVPWWMIKFLKAIS